MQTVFSFLEPSIKQDNNIYQRRKTLATYLTDVNSFLDNTGKVKQGEFDRKHTKAGKMMVSELWARSYHQQVMDLSKLRVLHEDVLYQRRQNNNHHIKLDSINKYMQPRSEVQQKKNTTKSLVTLSSKNNTYIQNKLNENELNTCQSMESLSEYLFLKDKPLKQNTQKPTKQRLNTEYFYVKSKYQKSMDSIISECAEFVQPLESQTPRQLRIIKLSKQQIK